jgi:hypothetical protein
MNIELTRAIIVLAFACWHVRCWFDSGSPARTGEAIESRTELVVATPWEQGRRRLELMRTATMSLRPRTCVDKLHMTIDASRPISCGLGQAPLGLVWRIYLRLAMDALPTSNDAR